MMIVSFYTADTPYEQEVGKLRKSLEAFDLPHKIYEIPSKGSWQKNTHRKPHVILRALDELDEDILYVDADATLHGKPQIDLAGFDWAAHIMDKAYWGQDTSKRTHSLMSGTLCFANNRRSRMILELWIQLNRQYPWRWDQRNLELIWRKNQERFLNLPVEYCAIDKTMTVENAIIRHHQASRRLKGRIC
ncbi:hypothetical protein STSP2_01109 [Anaerohalosphaera lusitana]|uniref:Nucleotide-diphospho-sugar transferase domain-containing protein n=1 Tax=Anaerohalosphaera lusitana TaxID=1936003 RepID=A0A1U9NJH4_9BACT|nr:hypothetical protein [Anaerohalosphaera lusitana]AQT67957.1 hypothetical protein STSP2_01109 [Anaerohalosphaera lusitana]